MSEFYEHLKNRYEWYSRSYKHIQIIKELEALTNSEPTILCYPKVYSEENDSKNEIYFFTSKFFISITYEKGEITKYIAPLSKITSLKTIRNADNNHVKFLQIHFPNKVCFSCNPETDERMNSNKIYSELNEITKLILDTL